LKIVLRDIFTGTWTRRREKRKYYRKSLFRCSLKTGLDFLKTLSKSKKLLTGIDKPVLIVQCADDESVRPKSAWYIRDRLRNAELRVYDGGCHQILSEEGSVRDEICRDIWQFLV
jgi:esterase/lipase